MSPGDVAWRRPRGRRVGGNRGQNPEAGTGVAKRRKAGAAGAGARPTVRRPGRGQQVREAVRTGPPKVGANRTSRRGSLGGELELPVQLSPASRLLASALC